MEAMLAYVRMYLRTSGTLAAMCESRQSVLKFMAMLQRR